MKSLIERLPETIARLEASHGSDNPFVKQLKEQLRDLQENKSKPTQEVYRMQAVSFKTPDSKTKD